MKTTADNLTAQNIVDKLETEMAMQNGWEFNTTLKESLEDTVQELMYADGSALPAFLRDLAYALDNLALELD